MSAWIMHVDPASCIEEFRLHIRLNDTTGWWSDDANRLRNPVGMLRARFVIFCTFTACKPLSTRIQMVTNTDDEQLVHLLRVGDVDAFNEIYARYWKLLFYIAVKRLNSYSEAEEAVQNIFTDLWARRATLQITRSLKYYLAAAAQYQVMNMLAKQTNILEIDGLADNPSAMSADHRLNFHELEIRLQQIVEALPEKCRIIYKLSRDEGLNNKAIAAQLGISEKTVENQLTKALSRLRQGLGDKSYFLLLLLAIKN